MVLPISGFLPVPLPMMIPFMGAQSLVIGKMFGEGFQYGKRKISAMPNEEFNKLTFESLMSNAREEIKASVPTMQAALGDMAPLVDTVVREFFNYISQVTQIVTGTGEGPRIFQEEGEAIGEAIAHGLGTHLPAAHAGTSQTSIPVTPTVITKPRTNRPTTAQRTYKIIESGIGLPNNRKTEAQWALWLKQFRLALPKFSSAKQKVSIQQISSTSIKLHQLTGNWH